MTAASTRAVSGLRHGSRNTRARGTRAALVQVVGRRLDAGCRAFVENLRLRTPSGHAAYPDVVVVCGPILRAPDGTNTVTNPQVIIEVLSESTASHDRGRKLAHDRTCPSLVEYVLVASQGAPRIDPASMSRSTSTSATGVSSPKPGVITI